MASVHCNAPDWKDVQNASTHTNFLKWIKYWQIKPCNVSHVCRFASTPFVLVFNLFLHFLSQNYRRTHFHQHTDSKGVKIGFYNILKASRSDAGICSFLLHFYDSFHDKSTISLGICLPAVCSVEHLEFILNKVIDGKFTDIIVEIPKHFCQFEESSSQFNTIDLYTM